MARINLLPWRENLRKQRQRQFGFIALGAVIVTLAAMLGWRLSNSAAIDYQNKRNNFVQGEINAVNKKIEEIKELESTRASLIGRMNVIQDLQISRPQIVHLFDEVVETLPDGTFLMDMQHTGSKVAFRGRAQSNARVSAYMRNIDSSEWLGGAKLKQIQSKEAAESGLSEFELTAKQRQPRSQSNEEAGP